MPDGRVCGHPVDLLLTKKFKSEIKTVISLIALFVFSVSVFSQTDNDYLEIARDVLKTEKKAVIAEVMELSETESIPFWELYNEYQ